MARCQRTRRGSSGLLKTLYFPVKTVNDAEEFWTRGSGNGEGPILHQALFQQRATEEALFLATLSLESSLTASAMFCLFSTPQFSLKSRHNAFSEELDLNQLLSLVLLLSGPYHSMCVCMGGGVRSGRWSM